MMPYWYNVILDFPIKQWSVFSGNRTWAYTDASDHYPVIAFSYADTTTPVKLSVPKNGLFKSVLLKDIASERYFQIGKNLTAPLEFKEGFLTKKAQYRISNNFSMWDNGCIKNFDYVRIESLYSPSFFWSLTKGSDVYLKTNSKETSSELQIEILGDKNKCLQDGDIITFKNEGKYLDSIKIFEFKVYEKNENIGSWGDKLMYRGVNLFIY